MTALETTAPLGSGGELPVIEVTESYEHVTDALKSGHGFHEFTRADDRRVLVNAGQVVAVWEQAA